MAVRQARTVQPVPRSSSGTIAERAARPIGRITLGRKRTGERSAGKPPAPFDVAGAGDGFTAWLVRHSQRKRGATDRPCLRTTAPALDPTDEREVETEHGVRP